MYSSKNYCVPHMEKSRILRVEPGHRYGHWTITGEPQRINRDLRYPCECACGTVRLVSAITLRNGSSTNCGCITKQREHHISLSDHHGLSAAVQEILKLISKGILPPADQFSIKDGAPSWTLPSIARILGIGESELIDHLVKAGSRFAAFDTETDQCTVAFPVSDKMGS